MSIYYNGKNAREIVDLYFVENRAKLLDIASFLDRIDRYQGSEEARSDFRYRALIKALKVLLDAGENRTKALQMVFSDQTKEPLESALGLKAYGAWEGMAE